MIVEIRAADAIEKTDERFRKLPLGEAGANVFRQQTLHRGAQYPFDVIVVQPLFFGDSEAELDQSEIVKRMPLLNACLRRVTVLEFHDVSHPAVDELFKNGSLREGHSGR